MEINHLLNQVEIEIEIHPWLVLIGGVNPMDGCTPLRSRIAEYAEP
jgi:hypothetical protein